MTSAFCLCVTALALSAACTCRAAETPKKQEPARVEIVLGAGATVPEKVAADELARCLRTLYAATKFEVGDRAASGNTTIYVGTPDSMPRLGNLYGRRKLAGPESYVVATATIDDRPCGLIFGADPAGVAYGVYGLLERLGCGFYLSYDTLPEAKAALFSFDGWELSDRPLVPTRLVFNWHNFLSGCSTWNLEHWKKWIAQSQKMGYNAVMVHAYGNNPMAGFPFRGLQKPVGYLSSTRVGRDWSTNHVDDVRRLWGGEVFDSPVFGSVAAVDGIDAQRTAAAQHLMADAFAFAERRGVGVYFAVDVDTTSANPQKLIQALPEEARFEIDVPAMAWMGQESGKAWLANPDSTEGYEFYRAQVEHLLRVYPQIDCLVVWHRTGGTPWMAFSRESMPQAWQQQYREEIARTPEAADLWHSHHMFAQAKIVRAFGRALAELNRADVRLAFGSWNFSFLPAADRFLPPDVALIPLDWMVLKDQSVFDTPERRQSVAEIAAHRPVIPIAWAHHDDGNYVGRPYTPYSHFYDRLTEMKCDTSGYGVIHWTTKPLDLYFKSLGDQVWADSKNQPLDVACRRMAVDLVGEDQSRSLADYLHAWITTMPKIGRETLDFFIDHELKDLAGVEAQQRHRLDLLDKVDRSQVRPDGQQWLDYFAGLERYVLDIYRTEDAFNRAKKQHAAGDLQAARTTMAACRPEEVIERFSKFSQCGGITRGEQGLVVTMNTRWLPHYVRFRQALRLDPVRYNFAPTSHDPLAQCRGTFTFHFDRDRHVWQCLGTEETGAEAFGSMADTRAEPAAAAGATYDEICRTGIESDKPITLLVQPILAEGSRGRLKPVLPLAPGKYELTLLMLDPTSTSAGQRVFDVCVALSGDVTSGAEPLACERVDTYRRAGGSHRVLRLSYPLELANPGALQVTLTPLKGKALVCGAVLKPINE